MTTEYFAKDYEVKLFDYELEALSDVTAAALPQVPDNIWITGAPLLWKQGFQGEGCKIGVLDSGIDNTHPDLAARVVFRRDYVQDGALPSQFNAHGTHSCGIICANGNIKGVAPLASAIDYRVLNRAGSGTYDNLTRAIKDAVTDGCNIINMSLGGPAQYPPLHDAIKAAVAANVLVCVAAGNAGPGQISYPAFYPEVVSVGAVNFDANTSAINLPQTPWFSNSNIEVDVACDGYNVLSTLPGGRYGYMSGTSMANPAASGFAALLWQKYKTKMNKVPTEMELYSELKTSTIDVLQLGNDQVAGAGFVTFYPELPKKVSTGQWTLPSLNTMQPASLELEKNSK